MWKRLRHRLNTVAPVFRNEAVDPVPLVAIEHYVFGALHQKAVEANDFGALQFARRRELTLST